MSAITIECSPIQVQTPPGAESPRPRISVRDLTTVAFLNTQPRQAIRDMGLPPYEQWISRATGLRLDQIITIDLAEGQHPSDTIPGKGVVAGGSGTDIGEGKMRQADDILRATHALGIPSLGICYSMHAATQGLGGEVGRGSEGRRFGIETAILTPDGRKDPFYRDVPPEFDIYTSHKDNVLWVPESANGHPVVETARGAVYPFLGVASGRTRLIQDHLEVDAQTMIELAQARREDLQKESVIGPTPEDFEVFVADLRTREAAIRRTSHQMGHNWAGLVEDPRRFDDFS
jgi:GMP synthase-like glutamine amidotransferase